MNQGKRSAGEEPAIAGVGDPGVASLWRLSATGRSRQKNAPRDRGRLAHGTCQTFTEGRGTTGWFVLAGASLWLIYRILKGWLSLNDGKPVNA